MLNSDLVLVLLFPSILLFLCYRLTLNFTVAELLSLFSFSKPSPNDTQHGVFSLARAYQSYRQYRPLVSRERGRYSNSVSSLSLKHRRIAREIGYSSTKLTRLDEATKANAKIADAIAALALESNPSLSEWSPHTSEVGTSDLARVRESMKHFVRDWSTEGAEERRRIFEPILYALQRIGSTGERVLVPGCGLGRLAWEISELKFDVTANELSSFMNLALDFVDSSTSVSEHVIHPYAHWFSHQKSNDSMFRSVRFPDVVPRLHESLHLERRDFLSLPTSQPYDFIVTLFFIDTSSNILDTLEHIHALLKPGGIWINLGPLLWSSQAKLELSLQEVYKASEAVGFHFLEIEGLQRRTIDCEYTRDEEAMMRWTYRAEYWVAKR